MKKVAPEDIQVYIERQKSSLSIPSLQNYTVLLSYYYKRKDFASAFAAYHEMIANGIAVDERVAAIMIRIHCYSGVIENAVAFLAEWQEKYRLRPNVYHYTSLIEGYSKNVTRDPAAMDKAEAIFESLDQLKIIPDEAVYSAIIDGYVNANNLDRVMDWIMKMIDSGITPGKYSFSILQKCALKNPRTTFAYWFQKTFGANTQLTEDSLKDSPMSPLETQLSQVQLVTRLIGTSRKKPVSTKRLTRIITALGLERESKVWSKILATYFSSTLGRERVAEILQFMKTKNYPIGRDILSLLILLTYRKKSDDNAWYIYQGMKEAAMHMDGLVYRNIFLIALKFRRREKLYELASDLIEGTKLAPLAPGIFGAIVTLLCGHKSTGVLPHGVARTFRIVPLKPRPDKPLPEATPWSVYKFHPKIIDSREPTNDEIVFSQRISSMKHNTRVAIGLVKDRLEKKLKLYGSDFSIVVDDAANTTDGESFLIEIHGILQCLDKASPEFLELEEIFYQRLFMSNDWRLAYFFLQPHLHEPSSRIYGYLTRYLVERGTKRDSMSLYTFWHHFRPRNLPASLITLVIEQLGIYCKHPKATQQVWDSIPLAMMTEDVRWAYVRSLVWWGWIDEVKAVCTTGYTPRSHDTGKVVVEICRWLKLKGLPLVEKDIAAYWMSRKPEWTGRYHGENIQP
ncbi:hypothetical protein HDU91_000477 [Kappamyces sp. JEL0680]|nr:hypothetical protein HDU91_000477 [Kappamyces sp. JEL0680]